jgi:hypothetical protein
MLYSCFEFANAVSLPVGHRVGARPELLPAPQVELIRRKNVPVHRGKFLIRLGSYRAAALHLCIAPDISVTGDKNGAIVTLA